MSAGGLSRAVRVVALGWCICELASIPANAASETWSPAATSGDWAIGLNWVSANAPGATSGSTNADTATFNSVSATLAIVPDLDRNIGSIVFDSAPVTAPYVIGTTGGNALKLSSGGAIQLLASVLSTQTVNAPLQLQGDGGTYSLVNETAARPLLIGGAITGVAASPNVTTLTLAGSNASSTVSGAMGDGAGGGKLAVAKSGSGMWTLSGPNTYSGGTTLDAGWLRANNATAFGTGTLTINGGTISGPGANLALTANNPQLWNSDFAVSQPNTFTLNIGAGSVTLGTNVTVTLAAGGTGTVVVNGIIGDGGNGRSLTVASGGAGSSTLQLGATNTYSGGTILASGTLRVSSGGAIGTGPLTFAGGALGSPAFPANVPVTLVNNNPIILNGSLNIVSTSGAMNMGTGGVALTGNRAINGANSSMSIPGAITNSGGTGYSLTVNFGEFNFTVTLSGANTFDGGLTLNATSATNPGIETLAIGNLGVDATASAVGTGPLTLNQTGGNTLRIDNASGADGTLATQNPQAWNGPFTFVGTRALNLGTGAVTLGTNVTLSVTANTLTVGGAIGDGGNGFALTKAGAGTLALANANTFTGNTTVNTGRLALVSGAALASSMVRVLAGGTLDLQTNGTLANSATLVVITNSATSFGVVNLANGIDETITQLTVGTNVYTAGGTYGSPSSSAGHPFARIFTGNGVLRIPYGSGEASVANTGATQIGRAQARLNGLITGGDPDPTAFICYGTTDGGTVSTGAWDVVVAVGTQAGTFSAFVSGLLPTQTYYYTCYVTNTLGVAWASPAATFTTVLIDPPFVWNSINSGNWNDTTTNGWNTGLGSLYPRNADDIAVLRQPLAVAATNTINVADARLGMLVLSGTVSRAWTLAGPNGLAFDVTSGSAVITSSVGAAHTIAAPVTLATNVTADLASSLTVSGPVDGAGALQKSGSSTLALTGTNTFGGGVTLHAGTFRVGSSTALGFGPLTINGGTLATSAGVAVATTNAMVWNGNFIFSTPISSGLNTGTGTVALASNVTVTLAANGFNSLLTVGGSIVDSGGPHSLALVSGGASPSALYLTGSNTYSGGTIVNGSLRIGHTQALGTGPLAISGGTLMQSVLSALTGISGQTWSGNIAFGIHPSGGVAVNLGDSPVTVVGARTLTIDTVGVIVGGDISGAGASLTINSGGFAGTLTLSGANSFDGGVTLRAGVGNLTLFINSPNALGTGPLTINGGGGGVRLDNSTATPIALVSANAQNWNTNFTFIGTRDLDLGTGAVSLSTNITVAVLANTLTVSGVIGDVGSARTLTKSGAGTLALAATNGYAGGTTVAAGTLAVLTNGTLSSGTVRVVPGATLFLQTGSAIADDATLDLLTSGPTFGVASLTNGVDEIVGTLILGGETQLYDGTYGSPSSAATYQFANYFSGEGTIRVVRPSTGLLMIVR